jgi:hypothetical protein
VRGERSLHLRLAAGLIAVVGVLALGVAIASASTDFTWSGGASTSNWSDGGNWGGTGSTGPSGSVGTLTFPAMTLPSGNTEASADDVPGVSANEISIDDGTPYSITGDQLTLGAGGINATTNATVAAPPEINMPIALAGPQTWSIDGGASDVGGLLLGGSLSGSGDALQVYLSDQGSLNLGVGSASAGAGDNEVGDVTITGESTATGLGAYSNGSVGVTTGAGLDATDGNPIQLQDAGLFGTGTLGSVSSQGGVISAGEPLGVLSVNGSVTLDSASALQFAIADAGSNPGTDFSALQASGNIELGAAKLDIRGTDSNNDCPTFTGGFVDTLLATSGTITGTFTNAANGAMVALDCKGNGSAAPEVQINYTANAVTATVLPVPTATTLAANPPSAIAGQSVTLTAIVYTAASFAPPSGTVAFADGGVAIAGCGAAPVGSAGTATCTTSTDVVGLHELTATFDPATPGLESPSTSPAVSFSVSPASSSPPSSTTQARLETTVSITGHGKVTALGPNAAVTTVANCPAQCSGTTTDIPVTLAVVPAAGWFFKGWGGACSGASSCTLDGPATTANVTATFTALPAAKPAPPPVPTITSIAVKQTTATVHLKKPHTATGLQCALVRDPTGKHATQPKPVYASCVAVKTYRHLDKHTSYTLYVRSVSHSGDSKPVSRRFTIHS